MAKLIFAALMGMGMTAMAQESADYWPQIPVSEMTCAEAQAYQGKYERFYVETVDGLIPIYPAKRMPAQGGTINCGKKERTIFHVRETLDNPRCVLGWTCISALN